MATTRLIRGGNVSLTKMEPSLEKVMVGLGWSARPTSGAAEFDLDASAFLLSDYGKVRGDPDFIFYNQLASPCGSVVHSGDVRVGAGGGDDETITVELPRLPGDIVRIAFCVTIHEAEARNQNFGMLNRSHIRVVNSLTGHEMVRYDLTEDAGVETAMIFGEIYRYRGEWKFRAVGQGYQGGLGAMAESFGVEVLY